MRAKFIKEEVNFERGKSPKRSLGIGIKDYKDYVRLKLSEKYPNENLKDLED